MTAYLIELGSYFIVYIQELKQYFIVTADNDYLIQFISQSPRFETWQGGKYFDYELGKKLFPDSEIDISEEEALEKFYHPAYNPGAVIAMRNSGQEQVMINDKNRFNHVLNLYS